MWLRRAWSNTSMLWVSWFGMVMPETSVGSTWDAMMWTTLRPCVLANSSMPSVLPIPGAPRRHGTMSPRLLSTASMSALMSLVSNLPLPSTLTELAFAMCMMSSASALRPILS